MKHFLLLSVLISFLNPVFSQYENWIEQTVPYDSGWVEKIVYVDTLNAWAIGQNLRTDRAVIMNTTNTGNTWQIQDESLNGKLRSVCMIDTQTGYAVGRDDVSGELAILKTTNGLTWENQLLPKIKGVLYDVDFFSPEKGCAVGIDTEGAPDHFALLYTEDGTTWEKANFPDVDDGVLTDVTFPSQDTGWCAGNNFLWRDSCFLLHTTDGGKNWNRVNHPLVGGYIQGIQFWSVDSGVVYGTVADTTFVMHTFDGGESWDFTNLTPGNNNMTTKSALVDNNCKSAIIYHRIYLTKRVADKVIFYGYKVIQYSCPDKTYSKHIYFTTTYQDYKPIHYNEYITLEIPETDVNTASTVPQNNNSGNTSITTPPSTVAGQNSVTNSPVILQNIPGVKTEINDDVLYINLEGTAQCNLGVNEDGMITVNGISTGESASNHENIQIFNTGNNNNLYVDSSGIDDNNKGSLTNIAVLTGNGEGIHMVKGSNSENIENITIAESGTTIIIGGQGPDRFWEGPNADVYAFGTGGNDMYENEGPSMEQKSATLNRTSNDTIFSTYSDDSGNDTIYYTKFGERIHLNLDLQDSTQLLTSNEQLVLEGQFENLVGSAFDDKIMVKPLEDEPRLIDGGPHETADTLIVDALGKNLTDDGTTILAEGCQPIQYLNFEEVIIINRNTTDADLLTFNEAGIQLYPNPFNHKINIKTREELHVGIFNLNGQKITEKRISPGSVFLWQPEPHVPSGIYLIRMNTKNKVYFRKVILNRI